MNHNDLNSDEVRRHLRAVDRMNTSVMPRWRDALDRLIGDDRIDTEGKAAMLGVPSPSRRDLFKIGGASILGAALLAACGSDAADAPSSPVVQATQPVDTAAPTTTAAAATTAADMDLVLTRTAASLEKLAVDTYGAAAGSITTPAVLAAATMFAGHHQMHLDALNGVLAGAGVKPITEMNQAVYATLVKPAVDAAKTETDAVNIASVARRSCGADLCVRRWHAVDARLAVDDHDHRWSRGPSRGGVAHGRALSVATRRLPRSTGVLPGRQPPGRHRRCPDHVVRSSVQF